MKIKPIREKTVSFNEGETVTFEQVIECCDSYIAVLTQDQIDKWFTIFEEVTTAEDAAEFTDFGSTTLVFDIDGQLLTIVSDSGGENASGEFYQFCEDNGIEYQFVIDGIDCSDCEIDEIYTGVYDDNQALLALLHKVFN